MNFITSFDLVVKTDSIESVEPTVVTDLQCQFLSIVGHYRTSPEVTFQLGYCGTLFYMHGDFLGIDPRDRVVLLNAMCDAIRSWSYSPLTYAIEFEIGLDSKACRDDGILADVISRLEALHRKEKAHVSMRSYTHFPNFPELEEEHE